MLRNIFIAPIRSCSKAPRGLPVFLSLAGIFTGIAFSPGSSPRQCFTRYAIRARPKLPDEVFCYLRTVIVTADIHRGLYSPALRQAQHLPYLTFRHWSGVTPYTSSCEFAGSCVFGKQSAKRHSLRPIDRSRYGRAYSEVTPAVLPSSLGSNHPFTLVFSTWPPVSVFGTVLHAGNARSFSWKRAPPCPDGRSRPSRLRSDDSRPDFPEAPSSRQRSESNHTQRVQPSVTPSLRMQSHGILTMCPSGPALAIP